LDSAPVGSVVEVCPEGMMLAQDIWQRMVTCGGAALIIDYGHDGTGNTDTLRAFHRHKQVHLLSRPGRVDVTADVNFGALKQAIQSAAHLYASKPSPSPQHKEHEMEQEQEQRPKKIDIEAFGPVTQGHFLARMGAMERVTHLIQKDDTTDQQAEDLFSALERLVLPEQMGERYKVMAICKKRSDDIFSAPPGF
jgi:NADH dehydrogenase [ubiquinone] 1 alpha subcomplex assembly factor 7